MTGILQPDFAVLDAYFDMWQQLAGGGSILLASVERLLAMPQMLPSLGEYQKRVGVAKGDLRDSLLSLADDQISVPSLLADFRKANQTAIHCLGYVFDIVFPLRRLRLARTLFAVARAGRHVPPYVRIMPDILPEPYLVEDALVIDFFAVSLDERGHIVAGGVGLDRFIADQLNKLL